MLEARQRTFLLVYGALLMSVGLFAVVAIVLARVPVQAAVEPMIVYVVLGLAALEAVIVIPLVRRQLMPPRRDASSIGDEQTADSALARIALDRLFAVQLVTWALCMSIAVFGLTLVALTHDLRYFLALVAASVVCFVLYRPSLELSRSVVRASGEQAS